MVTSRPRPSTMIDPPSSTSGASTTPVPKRAAKAAPAASSRSHPSNFSPQALNRKCTPIGPSGPPVTKSGPLSRTHESSRWISMTSTPSPVAARASAASAAVDATTVTGSKAATASATPAYSRLASSRESPHNSRRHGHEMRVRLWGAVSGGIRYPASVGSSRPVGGSGLGHALDGNRGRHRRQAR